MRIEAYAGKPKTTKEIIIDDNDIVDIAEEDYSLDKTISNKETY